MPITKQRKHELVATLNEFLDQSDGFMIIESSGLSVKQVSMLRRKVRAAEGRYVVVKNTLFIKALEQRGWVVPEKLLKGPVSVVFGLKNFPGVAQAVLDFTKDAAIEEKMKLKGGVIGNALLDAAGVDTVSKLPPIEELRAQLLGMIVQPATGLVSILNTATGELVNVLQAASVQLVNVLEAYVQKQQSGDGEAA